MNVKMLLMLGKKRNKRADMAVVVLVFLTIILYSLTLYIFNINSNKISLEIVDAKVLDSVYVREEKLDFYINQIIDKIVSKSTNKENFIVNFNNEIDRYVGVLEEELIEKIKKSILKSNFVEEEIIFNLSLRLDENYNDRIKISYIYEKEFRKII